MTYIRLFQASQEEVFYPTYLDARWFLVECLDRDRDRVIKLSSGYTEEIYPAPVKLSDITSIRPITPAERDEGLGPRDEEGVPAIHPKAQTAICTKQGDIIYVKEDLRDLFPGYEETPVRAKPAAQAQGWKSAAADLLKQVQALIKGPRPIVVAYTGKPLSENERLILAASDKVELPLHPANNPGGTAASSAPGMV